MANEHTDRRAAPPASWEVQSDGDAPRRVAKIESSHTTGCREDAEKPGLACPGAGNGKRHSPCGR